MAESLGLFPDEWYLCCQCVEKKAKGTMVEDKGEVHLSKSETDEMRKAMGFL
jgi:hypothetical protein